MSMSLFACAQSGLPQITPGSLPGVAAVSSSVVPSSSLLAGYSWQLVKATSQQGQPLNALFVRPDQPVSLQFKNKNIAILNTCNHMGGAFTLKGNVLQVNQLISTMKACAAPLNQLDNLMGKLIEGNSTLTIHNTEEQPQLTWHTSSGDTLVFKGIATPETRYGSQAETIFLEVAPQTQRCDAGTRQMQCLQVRQLTYTEQGLKSYRAATWEIFYDAIEGYQHNSEERVILRVKKYSVKNPPADASSAAYILDMVVERELVK